MTKSLSKKVVQIFGVLLLVCAMMPMAAFSIPSSSSPSSGSVVTLDDYQAVMDAVNADFGTDFHFATASEISELNIPAPNINSLGTLDEYDTILRAEAEAVVAQNYAVQEASALAAADPGPDYGPVSATRSPIVENGGVVGFEYI